MASIDDGELLLEIPEADRDELERGLTAARRIFERHGIGPAATFQGAQCFATIDIVPTDDDRRHADILEEVYQTAERAACRDWAMEPQWCVIELVEPLGSVSSGSGGEPHYKMARNQPGSEPCLFP